MGFYEAESGADKGQPCFFGCWLLCAGYLVECPLQSVSMVHELIVPDFGKLTFVADTLVLHVEEWVKEFDVEFVVVKRGA